MQTTIGSGLRAGAACLPTARLQPLPTLTGGRLAVVRAYVCAGSQQHAGQGDQRMVRERPGVRPVDGLREMASAG